MDAFFYTFWSETVKCYVVLVVCVQSSSMSCVGLGGGRLIGDERGGGLREECYRNIGT